MRSVKVILHNKAILKVVGSDSKNFLQRILTKDIEELEDKNRLIYSFLLNARGRISFDIFVHRYEDGYLLEAEKTRLNSLVLALNLYKLKSKVEIIPSDLKVTFSEELSCSKYKDPRIDNFGCRCFVENPEASTFYSNESEYLKKRMMFGIPEGNEMTDQIPLNMNGDLLNAISFEKGCYIGQELVSRTHHTGVVRRRIIPFKCFDSVAKVGNLFDSDGRRQGKIINFFDCFGIALTSSEFIDRILFDENQTSISLYKPEWWPII